MMRYRLLDTTRAYLLEIEPDEAALAARHATYYRRWLEQAGAIWATIPSADERAIHFSALHNVRAALDWCFGASGDAGIGIALAASASPMFLAMSLLIECRRWSERALLAIDPSTRGSAEEMHVQAALGLTLMFTRGGSEAARGALERSLAIAEARGDAPNQLQLLGRMGGAGVGVGVIFGNYLAAAVRNPSAAQGQFGNLIFGFAVTEALGIFSLLIALLLLFVF